MSNLDPDMLRAASLDNAVANLTGPLASGAIPTLLTATDTGRLLVTWDLRRPMLLVYLTASLETESLIISATLDPDAANTALPAQRFESYSEMGAALVLYSPVVAKGGASVGGFTLAVTVSRQQENAGPVAVQIADWSGLIGFKIIEGNLGKLLFVLLQEKARLRRQAREISAMRCLSRARRNALDRIGGALGVARFRDDIRYDAGKNEIITVALTDAAGAPALESDPDYARRIALYEPFLASTRGRLLEILNGPGKDADPNSGLLSGLGLQGRFSAQEQDSPFAVTVRIVGVGSTAPRDNFMAYLGNDILIWLPDSPAANAAHASRYLPREQLDATETLRKSLRSAYDFPVDAKCAPRLADALDRLGRVLAALGLNNELTITRAQDPTAGSRYELGLGVDLNALLAADLDDIVARVKDEGRVVTADTEAEEIITAARALPPVASAQDADGNWLLSSCGLATVHRLNANSLYVSHLPVGGLVVEGPVQANIGAAAAFAAHFYPANDVAINAALSDGLTTAATAWAAAGQPAWTQLSAADQAAAWGALQALAANAPALEIFSAAGLPAVANGPAVAAQLPQLPPEMIATLKLDAALATNIINGAPAAIAPLQSLVATLRSASIASAVPLVTNTNDVIVVVSVASLPQVGINLSDRRTSGFRWYTVPLGGAATIKSLGSTTQLAASAAGAVAVVCMGYVRDGTADPYEVTIGLPDASLLSLKQYEFLMNALELLYPIGVTVNTYDLRRNHVDLNGDGHAEALKPAIFRTYRSFRRQRLRGAYPDQTQS